MQVWEPGLVTGVAVIWTVEEAGRGRGPGSCVYFSCDLC